MTASVSIKSAPQTVLEKRQEARWILGGWQDFCFLHSGVGLFVLPVGFIAWHYPQLFLPLLFIFGLLLGLPHFAATYARLILDQDCRLRFRCLYTVAPFLIAGALVFVLYGIRTPHGTLLPYVICTWFLLQKWHINAQNFGIMRRYVRMTGQDPLRPVSRMAEFMIQVVPWAFILFCCFNFPSPQYLGYQIYFPTLAWASTATSIALGLSFIAFAAYLYMELQSWEKGELVPGRLLCVVTSMSINFFAWVIVREISWAYLIVTSWHALQYVAYTHAFRQKPPPGAKPFRLTLWQNVGLLLVAGLLIELVTIGISTLMTQLLVVAVVAMNLHHYLADMLIWRKPQSRTI